MKQDFPATIVAPCDHKYLTCGQSNLRCAQSGIYTSDLKHLEPWQKEGQTCYKDFNIDYMLNINITSILHDDDIWFIFGHSTHIASTDFTRFALLNFKEVSRKFESYTIG